MSINLPHPIAKYFRLERYFDAAHSCILLSQVLREVYITTLKIFPHLKIFHELKGTCIFIITLVI